MGRCPMGIKEASLGHNFTPLQTHKHEAASPLGSLYDSPYSFCWEPGAPAWQWEACSCCWTPWRQTWSCCCQTWTQTCWCQTCQTWQTSKQQWKIAHLDMHMDTAAWKTWTLDDQIKTWPLLTFPAYQYHFKTFHMKYTNL